MPRTRLLALPTLAALSLVTACGAGPASPPVAAPAQQPQVHQASATAVVHPSKLLVVMLENHSETHALDGMPKLAAQAKRYGYATDYSAVTHPSLPNYLSVVGGSSFGVRDDAPPATHRESGPSVLDQALADGRTAKTYAESMPANCTLVAAGRYAVKHNPWAYFADATSRRNCDRYDVPSGTTTAGALHADVASGHLPTVGLLIPNICDDAHDCALGAADGWLAGWLAQIQRGPDWRSGRLAVVVTFDEDDYSQANHVLTVVLDPAVHGKVTRTPLSHYSLSAYASALAGATPLRNARGAPSLPRAFGL